MAKMHLMALASKLELFREGGGGPPVPEQVDWIRAGTSKSVPAEQGTERGKKACDRVEREVSGSRKLYAASFHPHPPSSHWLPHSLTTS